MRGVSSPRCLNSFQLFTPGQRIDLCCHRLIAQLNLFLFCYSICVATYNWECCPVSLLIVRYQRLSWIQVLNCQCQWCWTDQGTKMIKIEDSLHYNRGTNASASLGQRKIRALVPLLNWRESFIFIMVGYLRLSACNVEYHRDPFTPYMHYRHHDHHWHHNFKIRTKGKFGLKKKWQGFYSQGDHDTSFARRPRLIWVCIDRTISVAAAAGRNESTHLKRSLWNPAFKGIESEFWWREQMKWLAAV